MPKLTRQNDQLELSLSGHPNFQIALETVKSVPGRRFDGDRKLWCFPEEPHIAERLMVTIKPEVSPEVLSWVKSAKAEKQNELVTPLPDDAELRVPWASVLYPYQRAAVDVIAERRRVILADDMGLGKTMQALTSVAECMARDVNLALGPKLVICPNSVKGVWGREIRKWLGDEEPYVIVDASAAKARRQQIEAGIKLNAWVIVNWEQIRVKNEKRLVGKVEKTQEVMREPLFDETEWTAVIADEAHRGKNRKSLQTKGLWRIDAPVKLALTGTPLQNSPDELWPLLRWLYPEQYGRSLPALVDKKTGELKRPPHPKTAYWAFFDQYVDYYEGQYGKIITGVKNPDALRFELSTRLIRRTKGEVLDLPEKVREIIPVTLGKKQRKLYEEAEKQMWFEVEQAIKKGDANAKRFAEAVAKDPSAIYQVPNGAARTVRLRQIASTPALLGGEDESVKLDTAAEIILDAQPKQFVVFTEFVGTANNLVERLRSKGLVAAAFTGEVGSDERTVIENEFQAGDIDVVVGTIAAMMEGITLHAADTVLFLERHWTPAKNEQAEDRLHRVGQKNNVTVLILEAENTVDTKKIAPTNNIKHLIVSSVINKDEVRIK